jgi:hypothetical protein
MLANCVVREHARFYAVRCQTCRLLAILLHNYLVIALGLDAKPHRAVLGRLDGVAK